MNRQRMGVVVLAAGLLIQVIARMASIRNGWANTVLTGTSVVVLIAGLVMLWRSRGVDRKGEQPGR